MRRATQFLFAWLCLARAAHAQDAPPETTNDLDELRAAVRLQREELEALRTHSASQDARIESLEVMQANAAEAQLLADLERQEATDDEALRIYGFMDFGWQVFAPGPRAATRAVYGSEANSFVFGNANLYFDARPLPEWRAMLELRFTNLPHGSETPAVTFLDLPFTREDRTAYDLTSPSMRNRILLGNVVIERAYLDYGPFDELHVQVGYFFTPYGIWNLDHATPTLISLKLPHFQVDQVMPLRQLGVQVHGLVHLSGFDLGYHAYVSNGRTVGQFDLTDDKAVGGRAFVRSEGNDVRVTGGISGYYGTFEQDATAITSFSPVIFSRTYPIQGEEGILGADLAFDYAAFRLRSEFVVGRTVYAPDKHPLALLETLPGGVPGVYLPNMWKYNAYVLTAYRLPFLGLEPYLYCEWEHEPTPQGDSVLTPSVGVNVYFNAQAQLKLQYYHSFFMTISQPTISPASDNDSDYFVTRLVLTL
jgi:hypothetical protein